MRSKFMATSEQDQARQFDMIWEMLCEISKKLDALKPPGPQATALPEFLTVREAADYVRCSPQTLYRKKHLHVRTGAKILRFRRSDLDRYFHSREGRKATT
jgi:excisionase family DNA binding protein